ncbi:MAG: hypothetical protein GC199_07015 [Alphaproteobacteria bacterium]|nr:hypothetical protein [Alphaproteobacteria bacterium]
MTEKVNPLKLNALQLRTLTVLQALARSGAASLNEDGTEATIRGLPSPHGDHVHIGDAVVRTADMSGLSREPVWNALARKGLARSEWPRAITLTAAGLLYATGLDDEILHRHSGH